MTLVEDCLIQMISDASKAIENPHKDLLLDFLDCYNLFGLKDATQEQLQEYITNNNLLPIIEGIR